MNKKICNAVDIIAVIFLAVVIWFIGFNLGKKSVESEYYDKISKIQKYEKEYILSKATKYEAYYEYNILNGDTLAVDTVVRAYKE